MIQRIQSLYLLLATLCIGATLLLPLVQYTDGTTEFTLKAFMVSDGSTSSLLPTLYLSILVSLSTLVPFVTIFLFKHRLLQIRLCIAEVVLLTGCAIMTGLYCYLAYRAVSEIPFGAVSVKIWTVLPIVAIGFVVLAIRAIFRDEMLIRSLNRIR